MTAFSTRASRAVCRDPGGGSPARLECRISCFTDDAPRATLINLTVTDTTGPGFLAAVPSDGPDVPTTSSINWFGPNQIIANTTVVRLGPDFDIKIYMGGSGSTHFVIDQIAWLE